MKRLKTFTLLTTTLLVLSSCGSSGGQEEEPTSGYYHPTLNETWQWQLKGTINTSYDVTLYDIDLFDTPTATITALHAKGKKVLCYFSAGSYENWREDKGEFLAPELGNTLDGWEDEQWLDIRSENVKRIMRQRIDLAKSKGCDGVEPDNVDGYTTDNNSGFDFGSEEQLTYNRFLASYAHEQGLFIALKNDLDQIEALVEVFDLAVNEQCFEYGECAMLRPFIEQNKPVLNAEYLTAYREDATQRTALCQEAKSQQISTLILPLGLDDSFRYSCQDHP